MRPHRRASDTRMGWDRPLTPLRRARRGGQEDDFVIENDTAAIDLGNVHITRGEESSPNLPKPIDKRANMDII